MSEEIYVRAIQNYLAPSFPTYSDDALFAHYLKTPDGVLISTYEGMNHIPNTPDHPNITLIPKPYFKNEKLYNPFCKLYADFLNLHCNDAEHAGHFFRFIVGMTDFYKIVVTEQNIEIWSFSDIDLPISLEASHRSHNYVDVSFSNGWEFSMRLHNASSKIKGVPLPHVPA